MVTTALMTAAAALMLLLIGAVYSAFVVSHKTDEIIRKMHEEPTVAPVRRERTASHRSIFGNA